MKKLQQTQAADSLSKNELKELIKKSVFIHGKCSIAGLYQLYTHTHTNFCFIGA